MKNSKIIVGVVIGIVISITLSFCLAETLIESKNVSYVDNSAVGAINVQNAIDGTCTKFSNELQNFLLKVYPVGSIYISTTLKTPSEVQNSFGGTWVSYGVGKTLLSSTTSEQTGGSNTVTLTTANLPAHTHNYDKVNANTGSHVLTIAEMPAHPGHIYEAGGSGGWYVPAAYQTTTSFSNRRWIVHRANELYPDSTSYGNNEGHTHSISTTSTATSSAGSTNPTAINVQNEYITVYMYKRTN